MRNTPRIGFIGLGAMGQPMAARIAAAGYALTVIDADAARTAEVAKQTGAKPGNTPADVASQSDLVVTMLPSSAVVDKVLHGSDGVLAAMARDGLILEMSSGVPDKTRTLAEAAAEKGVALADAPVSGGVGRARTGDLAIMFGGDDAAFAKAKPILESMGSSIIRTGSVGTAHAMKALNNLVSAGGFLIGIEALLIGQRFGLDPALMVDVLNVSTGMNNSTQKKFKQFVLSRKFDAGFGLDLMVKDLGIALGVAEATNTPSPFSSVCRNIWSDAQTALGRGQDHTALARFCEAVAGSELGDRPKCPDE
jgi:3-hydroxyisobutyrate dehydrogenase